MAGMENIFSYMIFGGMLLSGGQYKLTGREFIFITQMQFRGGGGSHHFRFNTQVWWNKSVSLGIQ